MYVTELFSDKNTVISMELFPPRTEETRALFPGVIDYLSQQNPDFFTVTFGAGGSTKEGTFNTVKQLMERTCVPTVAHVAGVGLGPDDLCEILDALQVLGVKNIFVVRGDESKDGSYSLHPQGFPYAKDIIKFIRDNYDFSIGCAGYPEGHVAAHSFERDIEYLYQKVESGADYILTQYFHDNEFYFRFVDQCQRSGITVPIIPGIMPVYSFELTQKLSVMCGASIPEELERKLCGADADVAQRFGVSFAVRQCAELLRYGIPGLHFYTMDRSSSICHIMTSLRDKCLLF